MFIETLENLNKTKNIKPLMRKHNKIGGLQNNRVSYDRVRICLI